RVIRLCSKRRSIGRVRGVQVSAPPDPYGFAVRRAEIPEFLEVRAHARKKVWSIQPFEHESAEHQNVAIAMKWQSLAYRICSIVRVSRAMPGCFDSPLADCRGRERFVPNPIEDLLLRNGVVLVTES